jgi:hypothetical protein
LMLGHEFLLRVSRDTRLRFVGRDSA